MHLVYFGSGAFGLPTLRRLHADHHLRAIVTQPDKPAGRGGRLCPTPVGAWAGEHAPDIPLHKPERIADMTDQLRAIDAGVWVVIAYGQKLGRRLLQDRFAINLHASLLPRWRGAAPINWAILAGDRETGNSVITLADRMDAGEVLGRSRRPIEPEHTTGLLHDLLAEDGPDLVSSVLDARAAGQEVYEPQDESLVTLAGKLSKSDGVVDFAQPAEACRNRVHGLNPWPGVSVDIAGEAVKVHTAEVVRGAGASGEPAGRLVSARDGLVSCGDGSVLRLVSVQPPNRRAMEWAAYANGRKNADGFGDGITVGSPARPERSE